MYLNASVSVSLSQTLTVVAAQKTTGEGSRQHPNYTLQLWDILVTDFSNNCINYSELEDRGRWNNQHHINKLNLFSKRQNAKKYSTHRERKQCTHVYSGVWAALHFLALSLVHTVTVSNCQRFNLRIYFQSNNQGGLFAWKYVLTF